MTGFGESHGERGGAAVAVEVRSINNRYLKLSVRCGEGYAALEPQVESALRNRIRRGTVQVNVRISRARSADEYQLNTDILDHYRRVLTSWRERAGVEEAIPLATLLGLPGVVDENPTVVRRPEEDWPLVEETLNKAVESLDRMRAEEGRAMAADLRANCEGALACLRRVESRAPLVADAYRVRLEERFRRVLAEYQLTLDPADLIKEVGLFAERSDISEEIVRLRSHFEQFETIMEAPEPAGRKLEFLTQEMSREANTIGSKANDVEIAREVIEIKANLERIREMIQNVE
ncbi:MAG TPA: YicC/YloC family endoribonuclease [Thermoguttaceae bacterium]|nr:YicC/YloC family endoribonuclease [Thermoguttaceae bacterium]